MAAKILSPCVDICKFRDDGYCIGCGQTKKQKKKFKRLEGRKKKLKFLQKLVVQQEERGGRPKWIRLYRRRYEKKGRKWPFKVANILEPSADPGK